jgi:hypothetical protein
MEEEGRKEALPNPEIERERESVNFLHVMKYSGHAGERENALIVFRTPKAGLPLTAAYDHTLHWEGMRFYMLLPRCN